MKHLECCNVEFKSRIYIPDILNCKSLADCYVDKLFVSKADVPIAQVGHAFAAIAFVGERMKP